MLDSIIKDELLLKTNLSDNAINDIINGISNKLIARRYTVVPTYLTDCMFNGQCKFNLNLDYKTSNSLYTSALAAYRNNVRDFVKKSDDIID